MRDVDCEPYALELYMALVDLLEWDALQGYSEAWAWTGARELITRMQDEVFSRGELDK